MISWDIALHVKLSYQFYSYNKFIVLGASINI